METNKEPKGRTEIDPKKVTNNSDETVNDGISHEHHPTNKEQWAHDVNEEFGDDFVLPGEEDDEPKS